MTPLRLVWLFGCVLAALVGCAAPVPTPTATPVPPTSAPTATTAPSEPPATVAPTATTGPSIEMSRAVLEAFFDAYNRHDVEGVLATISAGFAYGDCDFAERRMMIFEDRAELAEWLTARFAEEDQMVVEEMTIAPAEGSPPNDPRSTALLVARTHQGMTAEAPEKRSLFKIVLNGAGTQIQFLNAYGNVDCAYGR